MHEQCATAFGLFCRLGYFVILQCVLVLKAYSQFLTFSYAGDEHLLYAFEQFQSKLLWTTRLDGMSLPNFAEYFRH